jgi:hypothetical protein
VQVDGQLPAQAGGTTPYYGHAKDPKELWVSILEKAFAQWKGGYEEVGEGGYPNRVLSAFTGRSGEFIPLPFNFGARPVFDRLQYALGQGQCVVAGTAGSKDPSAYKEAGLHKGHDYTVMGVSEENGGLFVTVRDPWGTQEGAPDGILKLPMEKFLHFFDSVSIN